MITSAQLYWLIKLDDILSLLVTLMAISTLCMTAFMLRACGCPDEQPHAPCGKSYKMFLVTFGVFVVLITSHSMLPTTKQAAVIYAAPAVLGSEFVSETMPREAKELYGLAKEWLSDQVKKEAE